MDLRKTALIVLLTVTTFSYLFAETVTITVVQNKDAPEIAIDMSRIVEDAVLGSYFDNGMIVTNTDIRHDEKRYPEKNYGVKDAAHGLSDYVVVVLLMYGPNEKINEEENFTYAELKSASWKLVNVQTSEKITQQDMDLRSVAVGESDPYKKVRNLGEIIARNSLQALRDVRKRENH